MSAIAAGRGRRRQFDPWPGYVDVLSTLLMVVIFVLMVFVIAQVFLSHALNQSDKALLQKNSELTKANEELAISDTTIKDLQREIADLNAQLTGAHEARDNAAAADGDPLRAGLAGDEPGRRQRAAGEGRRQDTGDWKRRSRSC